MTLADSHYGELSLPVTDFRLFERDQQTPHEARVANLNERIGRGVEVVLAVGLTRPFQPNEGAPPRHWLQVNNVHLRDTPVWQVE
jgi:hypothetical protein